MKQPDIIFIVLDTQRADRLGCYGHSRAITPNLDSFAERSVFFQQAVSPAQWTIPSHASLFTGLYPTAHQVTQAHQRLPAERPHLAELLSSAGYQTVGFCNNPLVGILDNGFKRGFQKFFNYGGAIPSVFGHANRGPRPLRKLHELYTSFLRRISYPIQNLFGQSDLAFRLSLNAWLTPLWSRIANFKGQNARSVEDTVRFLQTLDQKNDTDEDQPLFLFLNLMETHLPFTPPGEFIARTAPYFYENKEARDVLRRWNREAYRWAAPLAEPLTELEERVLSDLYDAEVAYQDAYLGQLLDYLDNRPNAEDTMVIITADHGDGLGEHGYMGHAFVAYEELVHVPLLMRWPRRLSEPRRVETPVSTRRAFHTILDAAGRLPADSQLDPMQVHGLSFWQTVFGRDPENETAFSEVYPPLTFVKAIEKRQPALLEEFRCLATRQAVVRSTAVDTPTIHKLIEVDDTADELFDLQADPQEAENLMAGRPSLTSQLQLDAKRIKSHLARQKESFTAAEDVELDDNLAQRLRGLGYLD